jgi:hypothetical protein
MQIISEVITLEPRKRAISGGDIGLDDMAQMRTVAEVESMSRSIRHKEQLISHGLTAEVERI